MSENDFDQTFTRADLDAARAEGFAEALTGVSAIMALPEAKGREKQALTLACKGVELDLAKSLLADMPKSSSLAQRMAAENGSSLGVDTGTHVEPLTGEERYAAGRAKALKAIGRAETGTPR